MRYRPLSLQGRLLAVVLGIVFVGGVLGSVASYRVAEQTASELLDAQMVQAADTLLSLAERGNDQIAYEPGEIGHRYQQKLMFQVWEQLGGEFQLILRSPNAPTDVLPSAADHLFTVGEWNGRQWRFYAQLDEHRDTRVVVAEELDVRRQLAQSIAWHSLLPVSIGIPIMALVLLLAVRRSMRPLSVLADELEHRAPNRLEPVAIADPPLELRPVLAALGELFQKLDAALENERRFTADAAHELRTPLAALLAQLQVAQVTPDAEERRQALDNCRQGIDLMSHLVEQLLTLARIEATGHALALEDADLGELAEAVCLAQEGAAARKRIVLGFAADADVHVRAAPELLRILMRNVVDNGIRYTPPGGRVDVRVVRREGRIRLEVGDSGPGVPQEALAMLGHRFHRLDEWRADGVGLGLSIVRRIADLHGAELAFENGRQAAGLTVSVTFPAP